ncbi:hypothetical protein GCM10009785_23740 [Brooklawnia cerclae]|uniref:Urease accessory protein n=1 Tax=Brooklawnia cerclae TaxID=349934 RepID=A0ABX0SBE8_9ACTN|nr:urease accessory UreF family protein [Brooklawnia cerclae]NIH55659.1 urease accessory protein [Brooklawnia cerclae]
MSGLLLAFLADVRLPVGTHTQSAGLEAALQAGMPISDLASYVRTRLGTVTEVEAATAVVARATELAGDDLARVERAWAARTPSRVLRDNALQLGRGHGRLLAALWPSDDRRPARHCRAVALGMTAARAGLSGHEVACLVGYDDVQSATSALLKLEPTDPVQVAALTRDLIPDVVAMADRVAGLTEPEQIPAHAAPHIEMWAERHAHTTERLFRA